jgi:hypothetical protein
MRCTEPTNRHRKSGMWGTRKFVAGKESHLSKSDFGFANSDSTREAGEETVERRARVQPCRKIIRRYTALAAAVRLFAAVSER